MCSKAFEFEIVTYFVTWIIAVPCLASLHFLLRFANVNAPKSCQVDKNTRLNIILNLQHYSTKVSSTKKVRECAVRSEMPDAGFENSL